MPLSFLVNFFRPPVASSNRARKHVVCGIFTVLSFGLASAGGVAQADQVLVQDLDNPAPSPWKDAQKEVTLEYAQSQNAWALVSEIQAAKGNISAINDVLQSRYGTFEEAFSHVGFDISDIRTGLDSYALRKFYLGLAAEGLGTGSVDDPVVPELHAALLMGGLMRAGFTSGDTGYYQPQRVRTSFGLFLGGGNERRVDASSTDLIENIPIRNGSFVITGVEGKVDADSRLSRQVSWYGEASARETVAYSTTPPAQGGDLDIGDTGAPSRETFAERWKLLSGFDYGGTFRLEGIAGPQPLPVDLLPYLWDYGHTVYYFPQLGAMVGGGMKWTPIAKKKRKLEAICGFYGGYVGAGLNGTWNQFSLAAGSWGIENSAAYQAQGQRIWTLQLGISI